jgi:hypothetical protein
MQIVYAGRLKHSGVSCLSCKHGTVQKRYAKRRQKNDEQVENSHLCLSNVKLQRLPSTARIGFSDVNGCYPDWSRTSAGMQVYKSSTKKKR